MNNDEQATRTKDLLSYLVRLALHPLEVDAFLADPQTALKREASYLTGKEIEMLSSGDTLQVRGVLGHTGEDPPVAIVVAIVVERG